MRTALVGLALLLGHAAMAQESLSSAASSALGTLKSTAADRLLVADLIGLTVTGPSGDTLGTVGNLVAIPGGRLVAIVLNLKNGPTIAVPYQLAKVSSGAQSLSVSLPSDAQALRNEPAVQEMTKLLGL